MAEACPTCGCPECEDHSLNGHLQVAVREARRHHMSIFAQALEEHRNHRGYRAQGWPYSLELGFTCNCVGYDQEWRITIRHLREQVARSRVDFFRFLQGDFLRRGDKLRKRKARKASIRAKALLFRHISREQKWELRATKSFHVQGKDGLTYRITEGSANNVYMLDEQGKARFRLCVMGNYEVLNGQLPIYDLMLLQKIYLEQDPDQFIRTAVVYDLETQEVFLEGGVLLGELSNGSRIGVPAPLLPLTTEELDNPEPWVRARLQEAEVAHEAVQVESSQPNPTLVFEVS